MAALFRAALAPARLAEGVVQVWVADLKWWGSRLSETAEWLNPEEHRRAGRFHDPVNGRRWSAGRTFLRAALAGYLSEEPGELVFDFTATGKPLLSSSVLSFNLSHSGERAVLAVTSGRGVGVDVEAVVDLGGEFDEIAGRFFTPVERAVVHAGSGPERATAFYRCWTRKEAVMKANGEGLAVPPESITVGAEADPMAVVADLPWRNLERYHVIDLDIAGPYVGALAVIDPVEVVMTPAPDAEAP